MLLFDHEATLVSANDEAKGWLGRIYGEHEASWTELLSGAGDGHELVTYPIHPLVTRARAVALGYDHGPVRVRVLDRAGRWVVLHASCLDARNGDGPVAVVVEAAKSAEIAPIIVEAYALSPREREVGRALAQGLSTPEIAAEMYLSPHTVRDYVKSVFEKTSVSSRGELIANCSLTTTTTTSATMRSSSQPGRRAATPARCVGSAIMRQWTRTSATPGRCSKRSCWCRTSPRIQGRGCVFRRGCRERRTLD